MKIEFDLDLEDIKNDLVQFITDKCIDDLVYKIAVEIAETIKIDLENSEEFKKEFHKTILDYMYNNMYCDFEDKRTSLDIFYQLVKDGAVKGSWE